MEQCRCQKGSFIVRACENLMTQEDGLCDECRANRCATVFEVFVEIPIPPEWGGR